MDESTGLGVVHEAGVDDIGGNGSLSSISMDGLGLNIEYCGQTDNIVDFTGMQPSHLGPGVLEDQESCLPQAVAVRDAEAAGETFSHTPTEADAGGDGTAKASEESPHLPPSEGASEDEVLPADATGDAEIA